MSTLEQGNPLRLGLEELLRRWQALVLAPFVVGVAAVGVSFLVNKQYEGVVIFAPAEDITASVPGNLQTIAAQFGITAGGPGYNVYYFAQVAQSREVLRLVAEDTLDVAGRLTAVTEVVDVSDNDPPKRLEKTIKALQDRIDVRSDDQAELVTIRTRAPSPALATALTASVLDALNSVTTASIQRGGSAERHFAQTQADSAREALRRAEEELKNFYLANRSIASSPTLQFEEARLRRQIQIRQDLYLGLVNQAEAAKLREVRNTPAIAVVQPPQASTKKVSPRRSVWALFAMIGAFTVVVTWLYVLAPAVLSERSRLS